MKELFKGQIWHFSILVLMLAGLLHFYSSDYLMEKGVLFGVSTKIWFIVSVCVPIFHQVYVMFLWRLELFGKSLSKAFGKNAFFYFKIGFALLILLRPVTIVLLAISNSNSLSIGKELGYLISVLLAIPAVYLFYSVKRYFGLNRAFGMDHFYPEEAKKSKLVEQGIFKYSSNAMYVFGFLALWIPGFLFQSGSALLVALFSHLYIWVHYYFTEKPDMEFIYGPSG